MGIHLLFLEGESTGRPVAPFAPMLAAVVELALRGRFADDVATVVAPDQFAEIPADDLLWVHGDLERVRAVLRVSGRSPERLPALYVTPRHPFWDRAPESPPPLVDPLGEPAPARGDADTFGPCARLESVDWLALFWSLLQRAEEYDPAAPRDAHGRFPAWGSELSRRGWLGRPVADEIAARVAKQLTLLDTRKRHPSLHPPKASARPWTLAVTHDVDSIRFWTWRRLAAGLLRPSPEELDRLQATRHMVGPETEETSWVRSLLHVGRRGLRAPWLATLRSTLTPRRDPHWSFVWLRQWESGRRIRPTLFLLPERRTPYEPYDLTKGDRTPGTTRRFLIQMRKWAEEGAEIALHPTYDASDFPPRLAEQRRHLASLFPDRDLRACRFHWLRFRVPDSWLDLAAAGCTADATLGHAQQEGFRAATAHPFLAVNLRDGTETGVVEVPLVAMDTTLRHHRHLTPGQAFSNLHALMRECRRHGGVFNLLWHTNSFDRHEWRGWRQVFTRTVAEALEQGAIPATVSEIADTHRAERERHRHRLASSLRQERL